MTPIHFSCIVPCSQGIYFWFIVSAQNNAVLIAQWSHRISWDPKGSVPVQAHTPRTEPTLFSENRTPRTYSTAALKCTLQPSTFFYLFFYILSLANRSPHGFVRRRSQQQRPILPAGGQPKIACSGLNSCSSFNVVQYLQCIYGELVRVFFALDMLQRWRSFQ